MIKKLSIVFGVVFLAVGILGFVPGVTTDKNGMDMLLGIFMVDATHNVIHILSGLLALGASTKSQYARLYFQGFGIVYAAVAIIGLIQKDTVLGLIHINAEDNILHVVLSVALLAIGFLYKESKTATN